MSKAKEKKKSKDPMDGAFFPAGIDKSKSPLDFITRDGFQNRPGESKPPSGEITLDLTHSITGKTLPPRSIWEQGEWKSVDSWNSGFDTWVVSGEGTPGNYKKRCYELPSKQTSKPVPDHPADWKKDDFDASSYSWDKKKSSSSSSSGLPWGLRIRCPGCGHFFKMNDLAGHANNACPANQPQPAMWVIACECHENDLQAAAKVLPGFPVKPAPDVSGDGAEKPKEAEKAKATA